MSFGKLFASTFTGSMFGAGEHVHAVWAWCIANASRDGFVEINVTAIAAFIGTTDERVEDALAYLQAPDPRSRTPKEDGRRLAHEGGFQFRIVNHATYRAMKDDNERRAYFRQKQRESRARRKAKASNGLSNKVKPGQAKSMTVVDDVGQPGNVKGRQTKGREQSTETDHPRYRSDDARAGEPSTHSAEVGHALELLRVEGLVYGVDGVPPPTPPKRVDGQRRQQLVIPLDHARDMFDDLVGAKLTAREAVKHVLRNLEAWARLADAGRVDAKQWGGTRLLTRNGFQRVVREVENGGADDRARVSVGHAKAGKRKREDGEIAI